MVTVSVTMPVYNGGSYLEEAVESILDQTWRDLELIVVDDGSTDGSAAYLASLHDSRLRVVTRENRGRCASLNEAIGLARGHLIARMDADDVAEPTRIERQVAAMETNPGLVLLGTGTTLIDGGGHVLGRVAPCTDDAGLRRELIRRNPFAHPSVLMRRDVLLAAGGYDLRFKAADDYDLWFRLARAGRIGNLRDPLLRWRIHPASVTHSSQRRSLAEGMAVRRRAIRAGDYGWTAYCHLLAPAAVWAMPGPVNRVFRDARRAWFTRQAAGGCP